MRRLLGSMLSLVVATLGVAALAAGQDPGGSAPGEMTATTSPPARTYGTQVSTDYVLPAPAFETFNSGTTWTHDSSLYRYVTAGNAAFEAPLFLPAGARVDGIQLEACDTDSGLGADVTAVLFACASPSGTCTDMVTASSSGAPGCGFFDSASVNFTIDNQNKTYVVQVQTKAFTESTKFRAVRVFYTLQLSPAPATATFGDVPTNFIYFRAIEALAASGITSGCGGGNFCPNQNVTRGEMAVFLARALGLHWPL